MNTIAHISDIHLPFMPEVSPRELLNKRITGYLNWRLKREHQMSGTSLNHLAEHLRGQRADMTVVTGDMVNLSLPGEVTEAARWLKRIGTPDRVCIIPGNHDAYIPGAWTASAPVYKDYVSGETLDNEAFPYVRRVGEVAIIGCSSAIATPPFVASGRFGAKQASRLGRCLDILREAGFFRIVAIHHPPFSGRPMHNKLWGTKRFRDVIATHGAELVLHGHTHFSTLNNIDGWSQPVPLVGVAAASTQPGSREAPARYNLFQIERLAAGWSCTMREFGYQRLGDDIVQRLQIRIL